MTDLLRRILYPAFVLTIIATIWAMGDAQAKAQQAYDRTYWPPLNPELFQFAEEADAADGTANAAGEIDSAEDDEF